MAGKKSVIICRCSKHEFFVFFFYAIVKNTKNFTFSKKT